MARRNSRRQRRRQTSLLNNSKRLSFDSRRDFIPRFTSHTVSRLDRRSQRRFEPYTVSRETLQARSKPFTVNVAVNKNKRSQNSKKFRPSLRSGAFAVGMEQPQRPPREEKSVCRKRTERREVLFATGNGGSNRPGRWNSESRIKCKKGK